jgi:hypothetical protein
MLCTAPPCQSSAQPLTCDVCITLLVSIIFTVLLVAFLLAWLACACLGDLGRLWEAGPDKVNMDMPIVTHMQLCACAVESGSSLKSLSAVGRREPRLLQLLRCAGTGTSFRARPCD